MQSDHCVCLYQPTTPHTVGHLRPCQRFQSMDIIKTEDVDHSGKCRMLIFVCMKNVPQVKM